MSRRMMNNASQTLRRLKILEKHLKQLKARQVATTSPHIEVSKADALIDEKVKITVGDLQPCQRITLQARLMEGGRTYGACAQYVASEDGTVDTYKASSYGGTFQGPDPMGLFWSMKTAPGVKPGRLHKTDVMTPFSITLTVLDGFRGFEDLNWTENTPGLTQCQVQRSYTSPGVKRIVVRENGLYGTLFLPPGEGPFPAVMVVAGIVPGVTEFRAALLASHGFAAFSMAYIDHEDLPKNIIDLDFNYFLRAFDWFTAHPAVDSSSVGGLSTCVGGGVLQLIAALRPRLKCLASINSTGVPPGGEQTVEGLHVKPLQFNTDRVTLVNGAASFREMFRADDDVTVPPGWRHGAQVLFIQGLDDQCVNPKFLYLYQGQIPREFQKNFRFLTYPGAGHFIEPPYSPHTLSNFNNIFKMYLLWGGEPRLHAQAQEDSWAKILAFFSENLLNP